MNTSMTLTNSLEDHMETILQVLTEKKGVRASDIAQRMEVSKPSVTGALQTLAKQGLLNYEPYDVISLTDKGEKVAREVLRRHEVLSRFLMDVLAIPEKKAVETACGMEHAISAEIIEKLAALMDRISKCPSSKSKCIPMGKMSHG